MQIEVFNPHWRDGHRYEFPKQRTAFPSLEKALERRWIIVITGMRRTGKTTMMKQAMDLLVSRGVGRKDIVFFSFDEPGETIQGVLREYRERMGKDLSSLPRDGPVYLLLDEVQKVPGWQEQVKILYDHDPSLRLLVSGSSSLFLRKGTRESLAGRTSEVSLGPLSFSEFLVFGGNWDMTRKPGLFSEALLREYERSLVRRFVDLVGMDTEACREYVRGILEKAVYIDVPRNFGSENTDGLMAMVRTMASEPGMLLNYENLASAFGMTRLTATKYIENLRDSFLLNLGFNYSGSPLASERKMRKAYLATPAFALISDRPPEMSRLAEWDMFVSLGARFFWRTPAKDEVDIVLMNEKVPVPVEVKYKDSISNEDLRGVRKFLRRFKVKKAFLITRSLSEDRELPEGMVHAVPAFKVALDPGILFG